MSWGAAPRSLQFRDLLSGETEAAERDGGPAPAPRSPAPATGADSFPAPETTAGTGRSEESHPRSRSFGSKHHPPAGPRRNSSGVGGGGRAQRGGARGRPRAASPTARGTLSCRAAAGAELSGPVRPRGCANPALGYFCGAPGEESRAGSPPRVARESPGRKVRTLRAGTRPTPGPDPGLDPAPDPTPAAAHVPGRGGRSTGPARSGRGPGTRPARGALRPAPAHAHSPPPPALGRGGPRGS